MMARVRVLIVDDDDEWAAGVKEEILNLCQPIDVWVTNDPDEATTWVDEMYFDIAFVDVYFKRGEPGHEEELAQGIDLIRFLRRRAPGCIPVMMSKLVRLGFSLILELMNELQPDPPQLINKSAEFRSYFTDAIELHFGARFKATWQIPDVSDVARHLSEAPRSITGLRKESVDEIAIEVGRLLFKIFNEAISADFLATPPLLKVEEMHLGESGSVVLQTYLEYPSDEGDLRLSGTRCVVKINDRDSIAEENKRYRELVRMGVPSESRVELLEVAFGDALAAIC